MQFVSNFIPDRDARHRWRNRHLFRFFVQGNNNRILLEKNGELKPCHAPIAGFDMLYVKGNNNTVILHLPIVGIGNKIEIKNDNALVELGPSDFFNKVSILILAGDSQVCKIGKGFSCSSASFWLDNTAGVIIGHDCMFAHDILFRADDGHTLLDKETGEIINRPSGPITIGDHCWIGANVLLGKNARIPANTVVGMGSLVTKAFEEEYTVLAGTPASVKKRGVTWDRMSIYNYERAHQKRTNDTGDK